MKIGQHECCKITERTKPKTILANTIFKFWFRTFKWEKKGNESVRELNEQFPGVRDGRRRKEVINEIVRIFLDVDSFMEIKAVGFFSENLEIFKVVSLEIFRKF